MHGPNGEWPEMTDANHMGSAIHLVALIMHGTVFKREAIFPFSTLTTYMS